MSADKSEAQNPSLGAGHRGMGDVTVVDAAGRNLRVRTFGQGGDPLVLIHGFGGDIDGWLFNHAPLAQSRIVHAVELPGHGHSSKEVGDGSLEMLCTSVLAALDALGVDEFSAVGHSLGGAVALQLALSQCERVEGLSLLAPAGLGPDINGAYLDEFVAADTAGTLRAAVAQLFFDPNLVSNKLIEQVLRTKVLDGASAALVTIRNSIFPGGRQTKDLSTRVEDLDIPVQIILGGNDAIIPPHHAQALARLCVVHVLENAGHMVHMEAVDDVNRLLAAW